MIVAAALLPALLSAAPASACPLEAAVPEVLQAIERRRTARRGATPKMEAELWAKHGWQDACAPVAAAWLVDSDAGRRRVAAEWFWANRLETYDARVYVPIVSELFNFRSVRRTSPRALPLSPAQLDAFASRAAAETDAVVLRVQLQQLMELGELDRARALAKGGAKLLGADPDLLGYAFALWNRPKPPPWSRPERDLVWSLRDGEHAKLARAVLSLQKDPEWVAWLGAHLTPPHYEHASLAGLSPRFSKKVVEGARAQVARNKACFALDSLPSQLRGAKADEILALADVFLGCSDKLSFVWGGLLTAAAWSPEAGDALARLVRLQGEKGEAAFWRYGGDAVRKAATLGGDEAIGPMLEVLRVSAVPREDESRSTWRFAADVFSELAQLKSPAAADAVVEAAKICAGPCEGDGGDCLWRVGEKARKALDEIGGVGLEKRKAALGALERSVEAQKQKR